MKFITLYFFTAPFDTFHLHLIITIKAVPELVRRSGAKAVGRAVLKSTIVIPECPNFPHNEIHCASLLGLSNELP
jgi:hypothetical protein